jgi:hypothetical protein
MITNPSKELQILIMFSRLVWDGNGKLQVKKMLYKGFNSYQKEHLQTINTLYI